MKDGREPRTVYGIGKTFSRVLLATLALALPGGAPAQQPKGGTGHPPNGQVSREGFAPASSEPAAALTTTASDSLPSPSLQASGRSDGEAATPRRGRGRRRIPPLDPRGNPQQNEGPTDYDFFARPTGKVEAVMVFVDFPDARAGSRTTQATGDHLLGNGAVQKLFSDQSYGNLTLDVTRVEGWKRMPKAAGDYTGDDALFDFDEHKAYITDAAALFPEVRFSDYSLVFVVATPTPKIELSPAFNAPPGDGAASDHGEIRLAVTLGNDSYTNRHINIVHEIGHLFGLPDLYAYEDCASGSAVGPWDLMDNIFQGTVFFGWHRHKMGWLARDRKTFLRRGRFSGILSPLSAAGGISMVVIPAGRRASPSRVFVVELAEPVLEQDKGSLTGDGVLVPFGPLECALRRRRPVRRSGGSVEGRRTPQGRGRVRSDHTPAAGPPVLVIIGLPVSAPAVIFKLPQPPPG